MELLAHMRRQHRHNLHTLRTQPLAEVSGAFGDLGTLLPLMLALALQGSIDLSSTLIFSGLFNMITGAAFGIPLPVQPMKAIAAAAIASQTSLQETIAAGAWVSVAVLVLGATGLIRWLALHVPVPVVKGIQFGAGMSLAVSAGGASLLGPLAWLRPSLDNRAWAMVAFALLLLAQRKTKFPYALSVVVVGVGFALVAIMGGRGGGAEATLPRLGFWSPALVVPAWLSTDALAMAVGQLPLTSLNSCLAAAALAADLFPPSTAPSSFLPQTPSATSLALSVAAMNLAGCWFGAMPVCHGAGGLAAQHRFGARSGASVILLGLLKTLLGLFLRDSLTDLLRAFPRALLAVLVLAAGLELAKAAMSLNHGAPDLWEDAVDEVDGRQAGKRLKYVSDDERAERWTVMMVTAAGILAFKNDAVGFLAGMGCHGAYWISGYMERRRRTHVTERAPLLGA